MRVSNKRANYDIIEPRLHCLISDLKQSEFVDLTVPLTPAKTDFRGAPEPPENAFRNRLGDVPDSNALFITITVCLHSFKLFSLNK